MQTVHNPSYPCGCYVVFQTTKDAQSHFIHYCERHAAAPELLEACQAVLRLDYFNEHNALAQQFKAAIAKATQSTTGAHT